MKDLIITLQLIYVIAKTIHYNYKGDNFLSVHKYMDEIADPIQDEFIDAIKEKFFMANNEPIPSFGEIYEEVTSMSKIAGEQYSIQLLFDEIRIAIYKIDQLSKNPSLHAGTIDLLGKIASHFQTNIALLLPFTSKKE